MKVNEDNATIITKVVVGSRLHGLENDNSDWDYRGIFIGSLKDRLSPYKTFKTTSWIEGDEDNTSYEIAEFCKYATKGNATILEVFFSDQVIESSPIADEMRQNWTKFMDTHQFVAASIGYARNNKTKFEDRNPVGVRGQYRRHKFAVAYCRVLWQCAEFLRTGVFKCRIDDGDFRDTLLEWKNNWDDKYTMDALAMFYKLEAEVSELEATSEFKDMKPDLEWIENFVYRAYIANELAGSTPVTLDDWIDAYERKEITSHQLGKIIKDMK